MAGEYSSEDEFTPAPIPSVGATITWTTLPALDPLDREIHVANAGFDAEGTGANEGDGTVAHPYQTLRKAVSVLALRQGDLETPDPYNAYSGDRILLKKGDTFLEPVAQWTPATFNAYFSGWRWRGYSADRPCVLGAYGAGARPIVDCNGVEPTVFRQGASAVMSNMVFYGIRFRNGAHTGLTEDSNGLNLNFAQNDILIEDCSFDHLTNGIVAQNLNPVQRPDLGYDPSDTPLTGLKIRGCVFMDTFMCKNAANERTPANGLFMFNTIGALVEWCVFDHNGWLEPAENPLAILNWFRHSAYIANGNPGVTFRYSICMNSDGPMMRSGGLFYDNFIGRCYGTVYGKGTHPETNGVSGAVLHNVWWDGRDIWSNDPTVNVGGGYHLNMGNIRQCAVWNNLFVSNTTGTNSRPIDIRAPHVTNYPYNLVTRTAEYTTFDGNIVFNMGSAGVSPAISISTGAQDTQPINVSFINNIIDNTMDAGKLFYCNYALSMNGITGSNNKWNSGAGAGTWYSIEGVNKTLAQLKTAMTPDDTTSTETAVAFVDNTRSPATYHGTLGGTATFAAWVTACRAQKKDTWDNAITAPALNAYMRAGFTPV